MNSSFGHHVSKFNLTFTSLKSRAVSHDRTEPTMVIFGTNALICMRVSSQWGLSRDCIKPVPNHAFISA